MRRRLFAFSSATSLLLCIAVCVLWVRSRWDFDTVGYKTLGIDLVVERGLLAAE